VFGHTLENLKIARFVCSGVTNERICGAVSGGGGELERKIRSSDIAIRSMCGVCPMVSAEDGLGAEGLGRDVSESGYRQLAEFRRCIRQFLHFSEDAARSKGIEPHQHQLILAVKGLPRGARPTITALSRQLCLRHHSTVELVDRLEVRGAVRRRHSDDDRREVLVELTRHGEDLLHQLSILHWEELRVSGPALSDALSAVVHHSVRRRSRPA